MSDEPKKEHEPVTSCAVPVLAEYPDIFFCIFCCKTQIGPSLVRDDGPFGEDLACVPCDAERW